MDGQRLPNDFLDARAIKAAQRDRAAFGPVYDAAVRPVYAFCLAHGAGLADADDLMAETFIRALARLDAYDGQTSPLVWLLTIAAESAWERPIARRGDVLMEAAGGVVGAMPGDHPPGTTPMEAVARWERAAAEQEPGEPHARTPHHASDTLDDLRNLRRGVEAPALAPDPTTVADLRALLLDETMSADDLLALNAAYRVLRHDASSTTPSDVEDVFENEDDILDDADSDVALAALDDPLLDQTDPATRGRAKASAAVRQLKRDVRGLPAPTLRLPTAPSSTLRTLDRDNMLVLSVAALFVVVVVLLALVVMLLIRR